MITSERLSNFVDDILSHFDPKEILFRGLKTKKEKGSYYGY